MCADFSYDFRNRKNLKDALTRILSALPGREQAYSVGDIVFHVRFAFRDSDGETVSDM